MSQFFKSFGSTAGAGAILLFIVFFAVAVACSDDDNLTKDDVATIIAASKAATATPTATPQTATATPSSNNEQLKVEILKEVDAKIAVATGNMKTQLEDLKVTIEKANADTVASLKDYWMKQLAATAQPAVAAGSTPSIVKTDGKMPTYSTTASHGAWNIQGTDRLKDNPIVAGWLSRLKDPAPANWRTYPNTPNPDVADFQVKLCKDLPGNSGVDPTLKCVPDGMEYGTYSSPFCFAHPCDIPVGAWEYRYISGDYQFLGTSCKGDMKKGCMLVLINVMDQSFTWRNQDVDNGFTLRGRYFNGDALEWGVWGLVSHGSANMLNMETFAHPGEILNAGTPGNSGANCGNPLGCGSVDVTVVVHAGDAIIAVAKTTVTK